MATETRDSRTRLIAFYLPQFHAIAENDEWWGEGFTEWVNVRKAKPLFKEHRQPRRPTELDYYDLNDASVLERQATLARAHGIDAFCYYYYYFGQGKRLLEMPLDRMRETGRPDFPFCLCWANENWTRAWDGGDQSVLMRQEYGDENIEGFARSVIPFFQDPRYLRLGDQPILVIYHTRSIPDTREALERMRRIWQEEAGLSVHLSAALTFGESDPMELGVDSAVEFPPHNITDANLPPEAVGLPPDHPGLILDYQGHARKKAASHPSFPCFPTVFTGWDNTPRRGERGTVFLQDGPLVYHEWLRETILRSNSRHEDGNGLVFINAWNEWAEGAYLEPDEEWGRSYLEATRRAKAGEDWLRTLVEKLTDPSRISPIEGALLKHTLEAITAPLSSPSDSFRHQSNARKYQAKTEQLEEKLRTLREKRAQDRERWQRERSRRLRLESSRLYGFFRHLLRWENSLAKRFSRPLRRGKPAEPPPTESLLEATKPPPRASACWTSERELRLGDLTLRLTGSDGNLGNQESGDDRFLLGKERPLVENTLKLLDSLRPRHIVDLGPRQGGNLVLLNECCRPGKLVGVGRNPTTPAELADYLHRPENLGRVKVYLETDQFGVLRLDKICRDEFSDELLDLVIDDASSRRHETPESFRYLFPRLREGGLYIVEDRDRAWEPLTRLACELTQPFSPSPESIARVTVDGAQLVIERGPGELDFLRDPRKERRSLPEQVHRSGHERAETGSA